MAVAARNTRLDELVKTIETSSNVHDPRILAAFRAIPRERFVPDELADFAYDDRALPIGGGQTISQPSMIALMLEALAPAPSERALEVGAGSGYAAALLGQLTSEVEAIEIRPELAERAQRTLESLGVANVHVHAGDGALGVPTRAPFDVILVSAGARATPPELTHELAPGGRIAIPVGDENGQHLFVGRRTSAGPVEWERRTACVFVPLVSETVKRAALA